MSSKTEAALLEEVVPEQHDVPEVEVRGDEAVVRLDRPEGVEERRVKLPKTVWG